MEFVETQLTPEVLESLLRMSAHWAAENSCRGYYPNEPSDIQGNRIFLALEGDTPVGYLLGHPSKAERDSTVMKAGTPFFEVEELYIVPHRRSQGWGAGLFRYARQRVKEEAEYILLSTATKNWKAILHFYIEELDMEFWNARLFQKIRE